MNRPQGPVIQCADLGHHFIPAMTVRLASIRSPNQHDSSRFADMMISGGLARKAWDGRPTADVRTVVPLCQGRTERRKDRSRQTIGGKHTCAPELHFGDAA